MYFKHFYTYICVIINTTFTSKVSNFVFFKYGNKIVLYQLYNMKINLDSSIFLWHYLYNRKLVCRYVCISRYLKYIYDFSTMFWK
jgi:hypothetical protein